MELIMSVNELNASDMIAMLLERKPTISFDMNNTTLPANPIVTARFLVIFIRFSQQYPNLIKISHKYHFLGLSQ